MKFTLENVNIFDKDLKNDFEKVLLKNISLINTCKFYSFIITFDIDSLHDFPNSLYNHLDDYDKLSRKYDPNDESSKIHESLHIQLEIFDSVLYKNEIETSSITIQGDRVTKNSIIIELVEDKTPLNSKHRIKKLH